MQIVGVVSLAFKLSIWRHCVTWWRHQSRQKLFLFDERGRYLTTTSILATWKKKLAKTNRSAMRKMQPVPLVYAQQIVTFTGGFFHENLNNLGEKWKFFVLDDDVH